ncbi:MAG: FMN-binding protein [Spirochaetes bacterium]|nr:FMN-binding protein [Spirochaetota bacterium]MBU0954101.1 FMN-binding protein [Spirochaetota bacterium]
MKKDIFKLGLALALFAAGACAALAAVHIATKDTIAGHAARKLLNSQQDLFPSADTFVELESGVSTEAAKIQFDGVWKAMSGNTVVGLVIKGIGPSYTGNAEVLVGINKNMKVVGARILKLNDTPGLGANATKKTYYVDKATETTFPAQFSDKNASDAFAVGEDIIAITASTITSKGLSAIVKAAADSGAAWLRSNAGGM